MKNWVTQYLDRLGLEQKSPSVEYLQELQYAHILSIPFENTYIMAKSSREEQSLSLDVEFLSNKIVKGNQGGFCYELNGLFSELLRELGFKVHNLAALMMGDEEYKPDEGIIDHMVLAVDLPEGRYFTDVGAGNANRFPLKLGEETSDISGRYRIVTLETPIEALGLETNYTLALQKYKEDWEHVYIFSEKEFNLKDYYQSCYWMETTTKSHFTERLLVSKATDTGRITISGNTLKVTVGENSTSRELSKEDLVNVLNTEFGISEIAPAFGRDINWGSL